VNERLNRYPRYRLVAEDANTNGDDTANRSEIYEYQAREAKKVGGHVIEI
jgi:hypothetical protein